MFVRAMRIGVRQRGAWGTLVLAGLLGCAGEMNGGKPGEGPPAPSPVGGPGPTQPGKPGPTPVTPVTPDGPCARVPARVTRLSDRHLANALRDLLGLAATPVFETGAAGREEFLPNKAGAVTGSVALKLGEVVDAAALEATATGKPSIACSGAEEDCARAFIARFAARAFRRPLAVDERDKLLELFRIGRQNEASYAGGIRLVIAAVLQSPSFLYQTELGVVAGGKRRLTGYELAAKVSFFLRDSVPDDPLWKAAEEGKLETAAGLTAEVDRMMKLPEVKANVTRLFARLFQLDRIHNVNKAPTIKEFTPALVASMVGETRRFIDDVLWSSGGKLETLLTSRKTFVDPALAALYGVKAAGSGFSAVTLPADQRAGILTQPLLLTIEATPDDSSVVHRGVFIARELLCLRPPPPSADDLTAGEALKKQEPTERARAEKRALVPRCAGCHSVMDPFGVAFENYDTLGRWRTKIPTPDGDVPVDASWTYAVSDFSGRINGAIELGTKLAASKTVQSCMAEQVASYAIGQRTTEADDCSLRGVATAFQSSGGDLIGLMRNVAIWDGLRERSEGGQP